MQLRHRGHLLIHGDFQGDGQRDVFHRAAGGTNEVMVMVTAERLGDLETSELVFGHNSVHHACKFEYGEVSIRRTLR